jgi:hypothetical protein
MFNKSESFDRLCKQVKAITSYEAVNIGMSVNDIRRYKKYLGYGA